MRFWHFCWSFSEWHPGKHGRERVKRSCRELGTKIDDDDEGLHVLGCRVDMLGTNCNVRHDDDDEGLHVLGCRVDILGTNCKAQRLRYRVSLYSGARKQTITYLLEAETFRTYLQMCALEGSEIIPQTLLQFRSYSGSVFDRFIVTAFEMCRLLAWT